MEALQLLSSSSSVVSSTAKGKRSKRPRHAIHALHCCPEDEAPCSSLSEEEHLANCLIMLSNGQPPRAPSSDSGRIFQCKICDRSFHSYQALGGHAASHSKFKSPALHHHLADDSDDEDHPAVGHSPQPRRPRRTGAKVHECSVCHRIFPTGQALGGHKRSHTTTVPLTSPLLDLNMPPPVGEEDEDGDDECVRMDESVLSEDSHWPGPGYKMSPYFAPPWWLHGAKEEAPLFRYSDEADASSAARGGMLGGRDLDFQPGSVLVATVN